MAVEEFIRYVTPDPQHVPGRHVDAEVGGVTIPAGNQVVLMYCSANRDEAHFDDPERFDVTRDPNNHIAFGFGTHFCLGASLARLEIKVFFEELLRRTAGWQLVPGTEPVHDAERLRARPGLGEGGVRLRRLVDTRAERRNDQRQDGRYHQRDAQACGQCASCDGSAYL